MKLHLIFSIPSTLWQCSVRYKLFFVLNDIGLQKNEESNNMNTFSLYPNTEAHTNHKHLCQTLHSNQTYGLCKNVLIRQTIIPQENYTHKIALINTSNFN